MENVNLQKPFPLTLRARVRDDKQLDAQMALKANLQLDMAAHAYSINDLQRLLDRRDEITTGLAKLDPNVKDKIALLYSEFAGIQPGS